MEKRADREDTPNSAKEKFRKKQESLVEKHEFQPFLEICQIVFDRAPLLSQISCMHCAKTSFAAMPAIEV